MNPNLNNCDAKKKKKHNRASIFVENIEQNMNTYLNSGCISETQVQSEV